MAADYKISALIDCYGSLLSKKQKSIIEQYYNEDLSLSEIAENENITRQGVSDSIKRTESMLINFEQKLNFIKINKTIKEKAEKTSAGDIDSVNELLKTINELL